MDTLYLTKISDVIREGVSKGLDVFDFANSLSLTQLQSKKWLIDTLIQQKYKPNPSVLILGGWYGSYLIPFLQQYVNPSHIYFNDIQQDCIDVASKLHVAKNISFHCFDATQEYKHFNADIVINTSCEHMGSYMHMLKEGVETLFVLQSCDDPNDPGHINVPQTTEQFLKMVGLRRVYVQARRNLGHKNRFMIVGKT